MSILGFDMDWFDPISELTHRLYLKFFLDDNTIEILSEKSAFLKRIYYPEVKLQDLFVGNSITIYNRLYVIKGYANKFTSDFMRGREARFQVYVPLSETRRLPQLLAKVALHRMLPGRIFTHYPSITLVEVVGTSGQNYDRFVDECRSIGFDLRPTTNSEIEETMRNADTVSPPPNSTLALIKPHIIRTGRLGNVLEAILADGNFEISSLFCFHFTLSQAEELFDAYRGIFDDYSKFIENLCSGPVVAVGISGREGYDTVSDFREFAGPVNPQIAKVLRPESLRAQFGDSYLDNALHCTDLPEDGDMECRYIFNVLARLK